MKKTMKKDPPESSLQPVPTADDSGAFSVDPKSMSPLIAPIIPVLRKTVEHMKKSNEWVKKTNQELIKLNSSQGSQNRWLRWISLALTVLSCALGFGLWLDHQDSKALTLVLEKTNTELAEMVTAQEETKQATEDTKKAVEDQPSITVKPADTTDPSSRPVLVIRPKPNGNHKRSPRGEPNPPAPKGVEIPLDLPRKKKK